VEKCWREVLYKSVVEKCCSGVLEKCCRKVLEKRVVKMCCREVFSNAVLQRSVRDTCCREVLVIAAQTKNADRFTVYLSRTCEHSGSWLPSCFYEGLTYHQLQAEG